MKLKVWLSVVFALAVCLANAQNVDQPPKVLQSLSDDFWQWRASYQPFSKDDIPRIEHPEGRRDWSAASISRQQAALEEFQVRWKKIDTRSWSVPQQVDYRLIGSALSRVQWELNINRRWEKDPSFYTDQAMTALLEDLTQPPPFDAKRSTEVMLRMEEIPSLIEDGKTNLRPVRPFAQLAIDQLEQVRAKMDRIQSQVGPMLQGQGAADKFKQSTEKATASLEAYQAWLRQSLDKMPTNAAIGRANYEFFLNEVALLPYTPEQLFATSAQEWARSVAFEQYQKQRNEGLPALKIAPSMDAMLKRSVEDELAIRKFLDAKGVMSVPPAIQHYKLLAMPGYLEGMGDFGELDDFTGPSRLNQDCVRWIEPPSDQLGYFALATAKDDRPDMVHEGVPGHYFQMAWSWMHEDPIRRHYYDSGANEGIGFYAEEMMDQMGLFDNSPRTHEIIDNFMRLRALRVEVDVKLALGTFTMKQAAEYLSQHVPMDLKTAEGEAALFATTPGQAISYQIGKNEILKFLADTKLEQGDKFSLRTFHDFLWKNGNIPISLQRWEYLGKDDELQIIEQNRHH
ncbi:MAG TPA: DUF885 domain-containing protein [Terriglobales bacterium]|jgi:uncharacterized protein (DUF885 family)|nr:DUF885 domain-containing protein [Terriglobales bacterium]